MPDPVATVTLSPVDATSWRDVAALAVTPEQQQFVAAPTSYLCLCAYGDVWHPLAVRREGDVVGFLMWGIDDEDGSCWLGGILVDAAHQGRGTGRASMLAALDLLATEGAAAGFALSYQPENTRARTLYASLGFVETGETVDDEVVARRPRT